MENGVCNHIKGLWNDKNKHKIHTERKGNVSFVIAAVRKELIKKYT